MDTTDIVAAVLTFVSLVVNLATFVAAAWLACRAWALVRQMRRR
jgi:hypothetical protein